MILKNKTSLSIIFFISIFGISCSQSIVGKSKIEVSSAIENIVTTKPQEKAPHPYGGWYCPDNFGFPPVDIQQLETIKVVQDRLPTKEETRNGISLMYFDNSEFTDARPLDIKLPRVA